MNFPAVKVFALINELLCKKYNEYAKGGEYMPNQSTKFGTLKYKNEFEDVRVHKNVEICRELALILLVLNALLIVVDLTVYMPLREDNISFIRIFYSHAIMSVFLVSWLVLSKCRATPDIWREKLLYRLLANITLYWGVFLGLNDLYISGQISAYIISIFGVSAVLYISPTEALITYFISIIVFIAGLIYNIEDTNTLLSHIINIVITGSISYIVSRLRFISFLKDSIRNRELSANKAEIERSYYELEESNARLKSEIKERQLAEEKISHLIYYDALTGIFNRKKVIEDVNILLINKNERFAVLFIDLDKFKNINDNYGHEAGDCVLKTAAVRLKSIIGESDTISRIGGDEFVIILRNINDSEYSERIAQEIIKELSMVFTLKNKRLYIGASIGISLYPDHGSTADILISKADLAMYQVKNNGGCGYLKYSAENE